MIYSKGAAGYGIGDAVTVTASPSGSYNGQTGEVVAVDTKLTGDVTLKFKDGLVETFWGEDLVRKEEIPIVEIREGDRFVRSDGVIYWTALTDAEPVTFQNEALIHILVQFVDGGTEDRYWGSDVKLEVQRG